MSPVSSFPPARGHAVVIGGSVAGLLAARVLSESFERRANVDILPPSPGEPARLAPGVRAA